MFMVTGDGVVIVVIVLVIERFERVVTEREQIRGQPDARVSKTSLASQLLCRTANRTLCKFVADS